MEIRCTNEKDLNTVFKYRIGKNIVIFGKLENKVDAVSSAALRL